MPTPNLNTFAPKQNPFQKTAVNQVETNSPIVVIGAGAFGGWTALHLVRKGFKVTLVDAWGPGNARSSSGDETRVIRSTYGDNQFYFDLNVRALTLWKENEIRFGKKLFHNTGVLWLCYDEHTPVVDDSIPFADKHGMPYEYLSKTALQKRHAVLHTDDLHHGYFDPYGGYLKAREATQAVLEAFILEGGTFVQAKATPGKIGSYGLEAIYLSNGQTLKGACFIFACGAWLRQLFPDILQHTITCTKQEVYYFGVPAEQAQAFDNMPVWIDVDGKDFYYGIPGNAYRGFKIGVDIRGKVFDPTHDERAIEPDVLARARKFIEHRFPLLRHAPLLENRVCPYENSPDGNFIIDTHPEASNIIFMGGGSGHGFKHGPALGELIANLLHGG
jgi:glycine/D-amino acid oxidase-like deaminating enzyme